jgi:hypothetical protein
MRSCAIGSDVSACWLAGSNARASTRGLTGGVELSWTDARSTAFVPGVGFGRLALNQLPLTEVRPSTRGRTPGLLGERISGR